MKKEKQVRTYQRRTKSGKMVTVRAHTAKYDAAEKAKEAAKKKGAGGEFERVKAKKIPNLIDEDFDWMEFENNFEEGWNDEPSVKCLANHAHHREVANLAAYNLSKKYASQDDLYQKKNWQIIAQKAYDNAARQLYPKEKLWSGDNANNPDFWHEHLSSGPKSHIKMFWRKEWGDFNNYSPTLKKGVLNSSGVPKKVRPVGSGTNGPEPKKKKSGDDKVMDRAKSMYSHNNPSGSKDSIVAYLQKKGYSLKESQSKANSIERASIKERQSRIEQGQIPTTKVSSVKTGKSSEPAFTAAEFKEWYNGTGSAADKKVAKALRAQLGRSGYRKLEDEAIDNYSSRGHLSMFKRVSGGTGSREVSSPLPKGAYRQGNAVFIPGKRGELVLDSRQFREYYGKDIKSVPERK